MAGLRRFTKQEDTYLIGAVTAGTMIKVICLELEREKSSVSNRIKVLRKRGILPPRVFTNQVEVKIRIEKNLYEVIAAQAMGKRTSINKHIRQILIRWTGR